jgi:hypothetical protein
MFECSHTVVRCRKINRKSVALLALECCAGCSLCLRRRMLSFATGVRINHHSQQRHNLSRNQKKFRLGWDKQTTMQKHEDRNIVLPTNPRRAVEGGEAPLAQFCLRRASLPELPDQAEVQETNRIASRSAPSRAGRAPHYDFFIQRSSNPDSQKMSAPFNDFCASQAFSVQSITTI